MNLTQMTNTLVIMRWISWQVGELTLYVFGDAVAIYIATLWW